jgi:hypothetical protein
MSGTLFGSAGRRGQGPSPTMRARTFRSGAPPVGLPILLDLGNEFRARAAGGNEVSQRRIDDLAGEGAFVPAELSMRSPAQLLSQNDAPATT